MASTITAGTTSGTALNFAGDTSGILTVQGVPIGSTTGLGTGNASTMKNRIINGAMVIDQRNAGASVTPANGTYTLDRWATVQTVASKFSVQQNAGSVTPPAGYINYLGATSLSAYSILSSDIYSILQPIEGYNIADLGWGTANAKTVTLSFWVRSSLTGTFGGALNSGTTRSYPFTYTISAANTWEQKSITVAGDTTGTWNTANNVGLQAWFSLGSGSTYSGTAGSWSANNYTSATGATSVVGTSGATFYITGVQLEVGSSATGFEYRQYGTEFALCQRYYETSYPYGSTIPSFVAGFVGTTTSGNDPISMAGVRFVVTKRATPTCVTYNAVSGASGSAYRTSDAANVALSQLYVGTTGIGYAQVPSNNNTYLWHYTASAEL
jgi:hypothetical protein